MPKPLSTDIETGPGQGAGRPGPPGPPGAGFNAGLDLTGTSKAQAVIGFKTRPLSDDAPDDGDAYVYNATLGQWIPGPAGGGSVPRLSRHIFVDSLTAVSSGQQDGSVGKPFSTVQKALDVVNAGPSQSRWSVFIVPGNYDETLSLGPEKDVSLVSPGYGLVRINISSYSSFNWSVSGTSSLTLRNIAMAVLNWADGPSSAPDTGVLYLDDSSVFSVFGSGNNEVDIVATGPNTFVDTALVRGIYFADGVHHVGQVDAGSVEIRSTFVEGTVVAQEGEMTLSDCTFDPGASIVMQSYGQYLYVDSVSYYWIQEYSVHMEMGSCFLEIVESGEKIRFNYQYDSSEYYCALTDVGQVVGMSRSSACWVYIPSRSTVPFPVGCVIRISQESVGTVTIKPAPGVTFYSNASPTGDSFKLKGLYAMAWAWQREPNIWVITGELAGSDTTDRPDVFSGGIDGNLFASSGTTTLTRPTFYNQVILSGTAKIDTAGFPLYIRYFDARNASQGAIFRAANPGGNGIVGSSAGNTGGAGLAATSFLGGSTAGGAGGDPTTSTTGASGSNGVDTVNAKGGNGGNGGNGGTGPAGPGTGGIVGVGAAALDSGVRFLYLLNELTCRDGGGSFGVRVTGGAGGGGGPSGSGSGAGNQGGAGGGGGGGGGVMHVRFGKIITDSSTTPFGVVQCKGGRGGNGATTSSPGSFVGGGAGGGGGGGGYIYAVVGNVEGDSINGFFDASGGDGGNGSAGGGAGTAGTTGVGGVGGCIECINLSKNTAEQVAGSSAGGAQAGGSCLMDLTA